MKTKLLVLAAICCFATRSLATVYMVMVANYTFTPTSFNMHLGDTVMWMWSNGTHTTTSTTIPTGATAWNSNIDASATTFTYVPAKTGTYNYQCNFHASLGMVGSFTVLAPLNVPVANEIPAFSIFPNPAQSSIHLQFNQTGTPLFISMTDINGKEVMRNEKVLQEMDVNVENIPAGVYILRAQQGDKLYSQQVVINH